MKKQVIIIIKSLLNSKNTSSLTHDPTHKPIWYTIKKFFQVLIDLNATLKIVYFTNVILVVHDA